MNESIKKAIESDQLKSIAHTHKGTGASLYFHSIKNRMKLQKITSLASKGALPIVLRL